MIRIFFASPGDLEEERHLFRETLGNLKTDTGQKFIPLGFEDSLATVGQRPQSLINRFVDECDVFLLVFHRRWGQHAPDASPYTTYTEEEFARAVRRLNQSGSPEIFCFFKHVDLASMADPGEQLTKVLEFRRSLEESRQILYRTFNTANQFAVELKTHLLAYTRNKLPAPRTGQRRIHIPVLADRQPEVDRDYDLNLVRQASAAADQGHIEEAASLFARVCQTSRNIEILKIAHQFFESIANLDAAQAVLERRLILLHDRRIAALEYLAVLMSPHWLDELIAPFLNQFPSENRAVAEEVMRAVFEGDRFRDITIDMMAEHFTVGEILSLARFYRGEGGTIMAKFGHYMGLAIPQVIEILAAEKPELFNP
jgi:hypothetical protein